MKSPNIILLIFVQTIVSFLFDSASASTCPFDSYLIIDGVCHDATKEPNDLTLEKVKRTYRYSSLDMEYHAPIPLTIKKCSDFDYQETAQRHFEYHPENKNLDIDGDGYACENLKRRSEDLLTRKTWNYLVYRNRQSKLESNNKSSLSYQQVLNIIGFYPNKYTGNKIIWSEPIDRQKIEIVFYQDRIVEMKGTGFYN